MTAFATSRLKRGVSEVVERLKLDLRGLRILTEVGSGAFLVTPLVCLAAGAEQVFAWTRDTQHGEAQEISNALASTAMRIGLNVGRLQLGCNERPIGHIQQADIVTNLGHVRPIDNAFVSRMKPGSVVAYMCEAWERRLGDVDLDACIARGISVHGVWESHPLVRVFSMLGPLAAKLCFEAGFEVMDNKILVISSDPFGATISKYLCLMGASTKIVSPARLTQALVKECDFCFLCDYHSQASPLAHPDAPNNLPDEVAIVHLAGRLDLGECLRRGWRVYPSENGHAARMSRTLGHLGLTPVLRLHAAGIKVGENVIRGLTSDMNQDLFSTKPYPMCQEGR